MSLDAFKALVRAIDPEMVQLNPREVDMVLEDQELAARMTLSADGTETITDIFVLDVAHYVGGPRRCLQQAILTLNGQATPYADYAIGIDHRNYLILTGYLPLARATSESYGSALSVWVDQATDLREATQAMGFDGARLVVDSFAQIGGETQ
jgi:hypothetical protein